MYKTVEAILENNKVIFKNNFNVPKNNVKVLITFIENDDIATRNKDIDEKNLDEALKSDIVKDKFKELSNLISKWN